VGPTCHPPFLFSVNLIFFVVPFFLATLYTSELPRAGHATLPRQLWARRTTPTLPSAFTLPSSYDWGVLTPAISSRYVVPMLPMISSRALLLLLPTWPAVKLHLDRQSPSVFSSCHLGSLSYVLYRPRAQLRHRSSSRASTADKSLSFVLCLAGCALPCTWRYREPCRWWMTLSVNFSGTGASHI
jgi:hypothetical protein